MKKFITFALLLVSALALVACGKADTSNTLIVANGAETVTFDIQATNDQATTRVSVQIYETLVRQTSDLELVPGLATSWAPVDGEENTYLFTLRDDVTFHNGEKFTSKDVEYTMRRAAASSTISHIVGTLDVDKIEIVSEYQIKLGTKTPFGPFITHLAHPATGILNEKAVVDGGADYGTKSPVGTGPYKFDTWVSGEKLLLSRYEGYYGTAALTEKVEFRFIKESGQRVIGLENGEIDIAFDISPSDFGSIKQNNSLTLLNTSNLGAEYLGLNQANNPYLKDKNVRKAIAHMIDVPQIIETVYQGVGSPMSGPINEFVFGFNTSLEAYNHNETLAREFLAQSAWPTGGFTLRLYVGDNSAERIRVAQIVQAQLQKLGINVTLTQLAWSAFLAETAKGADSLADLFPLGWTTVTGDGDYGLYPLFHSESTPAAGNRVGYANAQVDTYLELGRTSNNQDERKAAYQAAQVIINDELPWVFLQTRENVTAYSNNIKGFAHHPTGSYLLSGVSKK